MNDKIQKPLITTIIPTYRRLKMLRRAIKSFQFKKAKNNIDCDANE